MQKLNCKIGDLAIVVNAKVTENIGQLVEVKGPHRGRPVRLSAPGHVWQVRTVSGRKTLQYRYRDGRVVEYATGPVPDCRLRPVSGLTGVDTLAEEASAVNGVDALVGVLCSVA